MERTVINADPLRRKCYGAQLYIGRNVAPGLTFRVETRTT